jgi:hypothetical protein
LAQIETLTGPPYLGRYPSSAGGRAAGEYLAGQFAAYGLQPAGDGGTFFQSFPVEYVALADVPHLAIERFDGTVVESYVPYRDFGAILRGYSGAGVAEGEAVWVNDCAREDFDLLDVVSKVVLCRDASIRDAQRNALEHGAAGLLLLTDPRQRPPDFGSTYRETWVSEPIPTFRVFPSVTQDLLLGSGRSEADLSSTFVPFPLLARVRMRVNTVGAESCPRAGCLARNVLGVLPGRDPQYNNQVVILGAHYDHLGQSPDGTVWAGANDNASGVAVMLEIAKRWHEQGYVPRRTVLFAAWDAEEMGLLGSRYYVGHPRYPLEETVAKIQLDMVGAGGDVLCVDGGGELGEDLLSIAQHLDIGAERTELGRSDHVSFQMAGVPASLLIWSSEGRQPEAGEAMPHYHRPMDVPAIIDTHKLDSVGKVAGISLLSLAEGEPAIRDLVERRAEAVRQGDLDAFLSSSAPEQRSADRLWFSDLQALRGQSDGTRPGAGQSQFDMQVRDIRVLGRTASSRMYIALEWPTPEGRSAAGSNVSLDTDVRFVHNGSSWQWAGPNLAFDVQAEAGSGDETRFTVAYPPGNEGVLDGLDRLAAEQYGQIAALLGLPVAPEATLLLFPDAGSLRAHTVLSLPSEQDTWVDFRVVNMTYNSNITTTTQLGDTLAQLALAEVGVSEAAAPWLWNGLPLVVRAGTGTGTPAYLADLQASLVSDAPEEQSQDAPNKVLSWAALEYLKQQVGWHGLGQFALSLGQACHGEDVKTGYQGHCANPDALDVALGDVVHMDAGAFEAAWRAHWRERLAEMQADLDVVLNARAEAVLAGDQDAFMDTLDTSVPNLAIEERHWFADLAENPVEQFSLAGEPLALVENGSLVAAVTMRYRLAGAGGRWSEGTVRHDILFTPADNGYRWAGVPLDVVQGKRVRVLYPRQSVRVERVGEGYHDLALALLPEAERMLSVLAEKLGVDPPSELTIKLYENDHPFRTSIALSFPAVEWVPAWAEGEGSIKIHTARVDDHAATPHAYRPILARYMARHLLRQIGVDSEWLLKGTSVYLAGAVDGGASARLAARSLNKVLGAALKGELYSLSALPPDHRLGDLSELRIVNSQSHNTITYLTETYNPQLLYQLLQMQTQGQDIDTALQSLVGFTLSEFETEWFESLTRGHARPEWIKIAQSFDPDAANRHVEYLAGPQLMGRQAGSLGADLAATYIAARFVEYGLIPVDGMPSTGQEPAPTHFLQHFPISYTAWISPPALQVHGLDDQMDEALVHRQDFVVIVDQASGAGSASGDLTSTARLWSVLPLNHRKSRYLALCSTAPAGYF